jgi:ABC-type polysaccharide transport system, permease component
MTGLIMAFKNYSISMGVKGIFTSNWVGFKYFQEFFTDYKFWPLVRNTVALSCFKLVFAFPIPIIFAIMLNEVKKDKFKRFVQTASYLPHFISWVIISGLAVNFLSTDRGAINDILSNIGLIKEPIPFLSSADYFWGMAVSTDIWKDMGWWAILFLAAITGIDLSLYEAADIDGASRLSKIWHITLPGIRGTITVVLILALGNLFGGGTSGSNFEQSYLLGNPMNNDKSEIIQTYLFNVGLSKGRYAYATAVGMIQSAISLVMIFSSNYFAKKISDNSLF